MIALLAVICLGLALQACTQSDSVVGVQDRVATDAMDTMKVYTVQITGVQLQPIEREETGNGVAFAWSDTLQNQLKFEVIPQYIILDSTTVTKRNMEEKLSYEVVNPVTALRSKSNFQFNKPVIVNGARIGGGKNFLADSILSEHVDFPTRLHPEGRAQLELDKNHFFIPVNRYTVRATWQTEQGEVFTDSTSVFINMRR